MPKPSQEDAQLLLKLVEFVNSDYYRKAWRWVVNDFSAEKYEDFVRKYPKGSEEYQRVGNVLGFFETAGVLVSHGLLHEDLFFDLSFGMDLVWPKISPIIPGWQKEAGLALWENAIWLVDRYQAWQKKVWKPNLSWKMKSGKSKK